MISTCERCHREEIFDNAPLCEYCLADLELGLALLGRYGKVEKQEVIDSIEYGLTVLPDDYELSNAEINRLKNFARYWFY